MGPVEELDAPKQGLANVMLLPSDADKGGNKAHSGLGQISRLTASRSRLRLKVMLM